VNAPSTRPSQAGSGPRPWGAAPAVMTLLTPLATSPAVADLTPTERYARPGHQAKVIGDGDPALGQGGRP